MDIQATATDKRAARTCAAHKGAQIRRGNPIFTRNVANYILCIMIVSCERVSAGAKSKRCDMHREAAR